MTYVLDRTENIEGNGENAGYQHFLLFPQCFQKVSFTGSLSQDFVVKGYYFSLLVLYSYQEQQKNKSV